MIFISPSNGWFLPRKTITISPKNQNYLSEKPLRFHLQPYSFFFRTVFYFLFTTNLIFGCRGYRDFRRILMSPTYWSEAWVHVFLPVRVVGQGGLDIRSGHRTGRGKHRRLSRFGTSRWAFAKSHAGFRLRSFAIGFLRWHRPYHGTGIGRFATYRRNTKANVSSKFARARS